MVVVGADEHKRTYTSVAVGDAARRLSPKTCRATNEGHRAAVRSVGNGSGVDVRWAFEDCRHGSARLVRVLVGAGQSVVHVPPEMMTDQRRFARTRGRSGPIDALAVARAASSEPDLLVAPHGDVSRELKLLLDRRKALVKTRTTTTTSPLLWRVRELDLAWAPPSSAGSNDLALSGPSSAPARSPSTLLAMPGRDR